MSKLLPFVCLAVSWLACCASPSTDSTSFDNVEQWINTFAEMPPAQQTALLMAAGFALQAQTGMDCNIFGGALTCKNLPTNTSYYQQCGAKGQPKADCIFYNEVKTNMYDSPVDELQDYLNMKLGGHVKGLCPQCFDRLQEFWCALAAPPCGTFNNMLQQGILPAFSEAVIGYNSHGIQSQAASLSKAVEGLFTAAAVTWPCREMCQVLVDTCSCTPKTETVGSLMTWLATSSLRTSTLSDALFSYSRVLLKDIWELPFCELFDTQAQQRAYGGTGVCVLPARAADTQCSNRQEWCSATQPPHSDIFRYIQAVFMEQIARAQTGWITDDKAMAFKIHDVMNKEVKAATGSAASAGNAGSSSSASNHRAGSGSSGGSSRRMSGGQIAGIVFLSLVCAALMAVAAVQGVQWWRSQASKQGYFEMTSDAETEAFMRIDGSPNEMER